MVKADIVKHRTSRADTQERRNRILQLNKEGKSGQEIIDALGGITTYYDDIYHLKQAGYEVLRNHGNKWSDIVAEVKKALPFWEGRRKPTLRTMHYHLETIARETGRIDYKRDTYHYDNLSTTTGIARKQSLNPDYRPRSSSYANTIFEPLPIDCFVDEKRITGGETDITEPRAPQPPDDPDHYIDDQMLEYREAKEEFESAAEDYNGEGTKGNPGGRWYGQYYVEVWVEKSTAKPYIADALEDEKVMVLSNGGYASISFMNENCNRLQGILDEYPDVTIAVLYVGDNDGHAQNMDDLMQEEMEDVYMLDMDRVEFHRIAVTDDQIKDFKASTLEIEAFLTPKNIKKFEKLLCDEVDEFWNPDIYNKHVNEAYTIEGSYSEDELEEIREKMEDKIDEELGS